MRISGYIFRQKLERDETVEASILGLVNYSHPASTELFDDAVVGEVPCGEEGKATVWLLGGSVNA